MLLGRKKENFLYLPTPLEYLPQVSKDLGVEFYIKRDDLTPLGMGGNKLRKLEYFVADAKEKGATLLLTTGGVQTNHGRLTLAVARKSGLKGAIVCTGEYPGELSANLLLDGMMGCDVWIKNPDGVHTDDELTKLAIDEVTAHYEAQGEKVYFIPMGGSNELGTLGYYECALEIAEQIKGTDLEGAHLIDTLGSMGTYMGLFAAIKNENLPLNLTGITILQYENVWDYAADYYARVRKEFGLSYEAGKEDFNITTDYDRGAYNNPCKEVRDAMYYMAEKEAIILDPCYTGKAFAGILEMIKEGKIKQGEKVIFLHTGGSPGINTPHHRVEIEKERDCFIHEF